MLSIVRMYRRILYSICLKLQYPGGPTGTIMGAYPGFERGMDMKDTKKNTLKITAALYVLMFVYAVFTTMTGTQLLILVREFGLDLAEGGIFAVIINTGCIGGIVLSAFFIDRFDSRRLVLLSYFLLGLLLIAIKFSGSYYSFLILLLWIGVSMKFLDASLNASISRLNTANSGFYMNLLHCSFGIGAFAGPLFTTVLMENGTAWRDTYFYLGIVCIVTGLVYYTVQKGYATEPVTDCGGEEKSGGGHVICLRVFCLMGILLFYCGHQMGINSWMPAYMQETLHLPPAASNLSVSAFWVGLIVSRLVSAVLTRYTSEERILKAGLLAGTVFLAVGVMSRLPAATVIGVTGAGLFSGACIPLVLTIGYSAFPSALGKISTLLFLCIAGGAVIFPWLMGISSRSFGLFGAMVLDTLCLAAAAAAALILLPKTKIK